MSERGSTDGGRLESIYNLMPKPKEEKKRPPMYKGKAYCSTEIAYSTLDQSKAEGRIYGIKDGRSNDPNQFLRCGEGIEARRKAGKQSELPRLEQHSRGGGSGKVEGVSGAKHGPQVLPTRRKPPVPGRDERPTMGLVSDKNFLTANAMDAILAVPVNRQRPPVDYLAKEDYGRVPEYLGHVKKEIRAENEMVEEFVREQMGIRSTTEDEAPEIPRQEQEELVGQLKAKWDNVNARYQQLAHHTFFEHGRLKAKARLEGELDEIEAYIAKLTRGPVTVVP
ncbi:unnamed protein product [Ascophyllum nodosum]